MILDSTYLLPLAGIAVDTDLLRMILEGKVDVKLGEISVSLISIFEVQAKAAKLGVPPASVVRAVRFIERAFNVIPFHEPSVIEASHEVRRYIPDYIDCVVLGTAIALRENLVTEDSMVHRVKEAIEGRYGVKILSYHDLVEG